MAHQVCIECQNPVTHTYIHSANTFKLARCPACYRDADRYVEYEMVLIVLDLLLLSPPAYRHIVFNRNGPLTITRAPTQPHQPKKATIATAAPTGSSGCGGSGVRSRLPSGGALGGMIAVVGGMARLVGERPFVAKLFFITLLLDAYCAFFLPVVGRDGKIQSLQLGQTIPQLQSMQLEVFHFFPALMFVLLKHVLFVGTCFVASGVLRPLGLHVPSLQALVCGLALALLPRLMQAVVLIWDYPTEWVGLVNYFTAVHVIFGLHTLTTPKMSTTPLLAQPPPSSSTASTAGSGGVGSSGGGGGTSGEVLGVVLRGFAVILLFFISLAPRLVLRWWFPDRSTPLWYE